MMAGPYYIDKDGRSLDPYGRPYGSQSRTPQSELRSLTEKRRAAALSKRAKSQPRGPGGLFLDKATSTALAMVDELPHQLPKPVMAGALRALEDDAVRADVDAMTSDDRFGRCARGMLAGIGASPAGRAIVDRAMDEHFAAGEVPESAPEVVVGAGLHAAIYCAVRASEGADPPLVLEGSGRAGGAFACSRAPAFYLNSRNRPGPLSVPGEGDALNFIPAGVVQPADLPGGEYQSNDLIAWIVRLHLAFLSTVVQGARVVAIDGKPSRSRLSLSDGRTVLADRAIFATGVGRPKPPLCSSDRMLTFGGLMARMNDRFPLRGMRRVAVIGDGDSGRGAVEALCGQGPAGVVASLDFPEVVDWYGDIPEPDVWEGCNRARYRPIGALLRSGRVRGFDPAGEVVGGFRSVIVDGRPYDYAVDCRGFSEWAPTTPGWVSDQYLVDGRSVARTYLGRNVYFVGPSALLPPSSSERSLLEVIPQNAAAIFRYADRTAAFAAARADAAIAGAYLENERGQVLVDSRGAPLARGAQVDAGGFSGRVAGYRSTYVEVFRTDGGGADGGGGRYYDYRDLRQKTWVATPSGLTVTGAAVDDPPKLVD